MHVNPYLTFKGECEAALKFYAKVLDGKVEAVMRFADMPGHAPDNWNDKVMHGSIKFGDNVLMGSDTLRSAMSP
jgi:PhnB protein